MCSSVGGDEYNTHLTYIGVRSLVGLPLTVYTQSYTVWSETSCQLSTTMIALWNQRSLHKAYEHRVTRSHARNNDCRILRSFFTAKETGKWPRRESVVACVLRSTAIDEDRDTSVPVPASRKLVVVQYLLWPRFNARCCFPVAATAVV